MATLTRVEVVDTDGQLAGLFFTRVPLARCREKLFPLDFKGVLGEWVPAGGSYYDAAGANAWFHAAVVLGQMVEVPDDG